MQGTLSSALKQKLAENPGIVFEERQYMGRPSAHAVFLNSDGGIMFKVFVGRDEKRDLLVDQLAKFRALRERLCA